MADVVPIAPGELTRWQKMSPEQKERHRETCRAYRARNPGKSRETYERFKRNHPGKRKEQYRRDRDRILAKLRERKYGLTPDALATLLAGQDGKCAICRTALDSSTKSTTPHVDHDHRTGAIRGLLCDMCNKGIGSLRDDPENILAAYRYLVGSDGQ